MNTPVFVCFVDIKFASDRVSHNKLFFKLIEKGVPFYLVLLLLDWYTTQRLHAGWGSAQSEGTILRLYMFNLYVDACIYFELESENIEISLH